MEKEHIFALVYLLLILFLGIVVIYKVHKYLLKNSNKNEHTS